MNTPDGYAVVMNNGKGNFVGIWRTRKVAENILSKGKAEHNEIIVPVFFHRALHREEEK